MHKILNIHYEEFESVNELDESDRELLNLAYAATKMAYAPYSNFLVGAAARLQDGRVISGANLENATYSAIICAERVLIANAMMQAPQVPVVALAVNYDGPDDLTAAVSPCGICRQVLSEHEHITKQPIRLIMGSPVGKVRIVTGVDSLLPLVFSPGIMG